MNSKINLCNVCQLHVATCGGDNVEFGDGLGNDNVVDCDTFRPVRRMDIDLKNRDKIINILGAYTCFLEDYGYIDADWVAEQPTAIDTFLTKTKDYGLEIK